MIVYFSGTGNSLYCADFLADKLNDLTLDSSVFIKNKTGAKIKTEKPIIFVCPTYSWQIPHVFRDFIKKSTWRGNNNTYFVMTCGSDIGNARKSNIEICEEKSFNYMGTLEVIMPENYIAMFKAPEKEEAEKIIRAALPALEKGADHILNEENLPEKKITPVDKLKSGPVNNIFYPLFVKSKPYKVLPSCIGCGKCASLCPMGNIRLKDGTPVWGTECTQCMACINICPVNAIEYGKKSVGKTRYICPKYK